jgi:excisionase family DNA binding protein
VSERLLTTREVAIIIRVATETVLRWHRNGKLPFAIRLPGGELRFRERGLQDWLAARATPGQGAQTTLTTSAALAASQPALLSSVAQTTDDDDKE